MKITFITPNFSLLKQTKQNNTLHLPNSIQSQSLDTVSFKGAKKREQKPMVESPFVTDMRELDLHCACCGHLMLKNKTVNNCLNKDIYFPAKEALERIKYEQKFRLNEQAPHIQTAYSYLKRKANEHPDLSTNELTSKKSVLDELKLVNRNVKQGVQNLRNRANLVSHSSKHVISVIESLNPDFQPNEDAVFQDLKHLSKIYPEETLYDILNKPEVKNVYLERLQNKQNNRLKKVQYLIEQLSPPIQKKANRALNKSYKIFNVESSDILHKRGRVIELFEKVFETIPETDTKDKEIANYILKRLDALPNSKNDVNSFMIKGSQKSSNAIVETLITRARNTNEHVKPHHRKNDPGASNYSNYISLCGKCNNERKTTKYSEFVEKHPEMPKNTQIQIDEVCDYINKGIFIEHDTWPKDIQEPLSRESNGLININYDKLNIEEAKQNRSSKREEYIEKQKSTPTPRESSTTPVKRNPKK